MAVINKNIEIIQSKLLVVEGKDARLFLRSACKEYGIDGIQIEDFGGIKEIGKKLEPLKNLPNFERVKTLGIARDAEDSVENAVRSVQGALEAAGFPAPKSPYAFIDGKIKIGFYIFPGPENQDTNDNSSKMTLENLCLSTVQGDPVFDCVDIFLECISNIGENPKWPHKSKLHCYLSGKSKFAGMKIGEASSAGAWDWNHTAMTSLRTFLESM